MEDGLPFPFELRGLILSFVDDEHAVLFAVTCKQEFNRYMRTVKPEARLSYRQLMYRYYDQEAIGDLFPGEKGYAQEKKEYDRRMAKLVKSEWTRPMALRRKAEERKARGRQKGRWKKGIYDD
jgi:hypothetical protein